MEWSGRAPALPHMMLGRGCQLKEHRHVQQISRDHFHHGHWYWQESVPRSANGSMRVAPAAITCWGMLDRKGGDCPRDCWSLTDGKNPIAFTLVRVRRWKSRSSLWRAICWLAATLYLLLLTRMMAVRAVWSSIRSCPRKDDTRFVLDSDMKRNQANLNWG